MPRTRSKAPEAAREPEPESPVLGHLRDGTLVRIRPPTHDDLPRVAEFVRGLSRESLEYRYFSEVTPERVTTEILAPPASPERVSLIVEVAGPAVGPIVAHGVYERGAAEPIRAEVAFLVADAWQGRGVGTLLLLRLARLAASVGVQQLEAILLAENQPMIDVFVGAGYPCSITWHEGEGLVLLEIGHEPTPPGAPRGAFPEYRPVTA